MWYQLEAVRALNQAVGRIIRHAKDFGAILLCDERCDSPDVLRNFSPWLEKRLTKIANFSDMMQGLSKFFNSSSTSVSTHKA
jgi:regulator of telomere elongation helicase 1